MELKVVKHKLADVKIRPKTCWGFIFDALDKLDDPEDCLTINLGKDQDEAHAISDRMRAAIYGYKPKAFRTSLIMNDRFEMVFVISMRTGE